MRRWLAALLVGAILVGAVVAVVVVATAPGPKPPSAGGTSTTSSRSSGTTGTTSPGGGGTPSTTRPSTTTTTTLPPPTGPVQLGADVWWPNIDTSSLSFDQERSTEIVSYLTNVLHANAVTLCFPIYTASPTSDSVFTTAETPSPSQLDIFVKTAQQAGLRVALRPLLNIGTLSYSWRGKVMPANLHAFFTSYAATIQPYLALAAADGVPTFVYASELWQLSVHPQYVKDWRYFVSVLRKTYHGQLEYDSSGVPYRLGQVKVPGYGSYTDAYFQVAADPSASVTTLYKAWIALLGKLPPSELARTVFQEVGFATRPDGYRLPARVVSGTTDPNYLFMQGRWMTMVCRVVHHLHIHGVYFWTIYFRADPYSYSSQPIWEADPTTWVARPGAAAISSCFQHFSS